MAGRSSAAQFFSFGLVGLIATLSHYCVMFLGLLLLQMPVFWSFAGAVVGAVVGYILNYVYTFQSTQPHRDTFLRYALITIFSILLNTALFFAFFEIFGLPVPVSQLISTGLVFVANYFAHKTITFDIGTTKSP
ncbi:GtrA family protein [Cognatiyoonia sp. IB215446]|uniref:GtrA family protein n=1 Tax=Cognatiyoonia sp. IB215446 TaxID=3097355 RepID=UPI002A116381|nr:GtrA family protein [Cognatiyoonia sp. IB215446]MDX8348565.1 GtrA family protein [Cognatiyoonia sp. IB215446]